MRHDSLPALSLRFYRHHFVLPAACFTHRLHPAASTPHIQLSLSLSLSLPLHPPSLSVSSSKGKRIRGHMQSISIRKVSPFPTVHLSDNNPPPPPPPAGNTTLCAFPPSLALRSLLIPRNAASFVVPSSPPCLDQRGRCSCRVAGGGCAGLSLPCIPEAVPLLACCGDLRWRINQLATRRLASR